MTKTEIDDALFTASTNVLETMFFSEAASAAGEDRLHENPTVCLLHSGGAADGTFSIAVDGEALRLLCVSFYGEDAPALIRQEELACELANMVAGSTLSTLVPERYCALTAPKIASMDEHNALSAGSADSTTVIMQVEGGLLSIACQLRME